MVRPFKLMCAVCVQVFSFLNNASSTLWEAIMSWAHGIIQDSIIGPLHANNRHPPRVSLERQGLVSKQLYACFTFHQAIQPCWQLKILRRSHSCSWLHTFYSVAWCSSITRNALSIIKRLWLIAVHSSFGVPTAFVPVKQFWCVCCFLWCPLHSLLNTIKRLVCKSCDRAKPKWSNREMIIHTPPRLDTCTGTSYTVARQ